MKASNPPKDKRTKAYKEWKAKYDNQSKGLGDTVKKVFDKKNANDAPMEAEMKTIIDPKYEPYKKPDNKDNQEAGSINKTIKI